MLKMERYRMVPGPVARVNRKRPSLNGTMIKPHEILGVAVDARGEAIKRAYLKRAATAHPDAGGSDEEFLLVRTAYEAMSLSAEMRAAAAGAPPPVDTEADARASLDEIMKAARRRLDETAASPLSESRERMPDGVKDFFIAVVLTPLCAGALGACLCYDGRPFEAGVWTFSSLIALGVLLYLGGLIAVLAGARGASGLKIYWRVIAVFSLLPALAITAALMQHKDASGEQPRPLISRKQVPDWWPGRNDAWSSSR